MQTSNKFKPCKMCHCSACRRGSTYKNDAIKAGNRKFRRSGRTILGPNVILNADDFEDYIVDYGDPLDPKDRVDVYDEPRVPGIFEILEPAIVSIGYTD